MIRTEAPSLGPFLSSPLSKLINFWIEMKNIAEQLISLPIFVLNVFDGRERRNDSQRSQRLLEDVYPKSRFTDNFQGPYPSALIKGTLTV